jgi:hypothetical protein
MWKVTGLLSDKSRQLSKVYGPMPVKHWVKDGKRHRVSSKPTNGLKKIARDKSEDSRLAVEYAIWLAARDGIALPAGTYGRAEFVYVDAVKQLRPCFVRFGSVTIELPNYDWVPTDPVCVIVEDEALPLAA